MDIIILEKERNRKGDLFNRMIFEVFHSLGFEEPHYNVPKTGREIDMILQHRAESRMAIVECKAQEKQVGGDDINKFVGLLEVESGKYEKEGKNIVGYFVSKSGFKESALAQEKERNETKGRREIVLLGPDEIKRELISGKVLCPLEKAVDAIRNIKDDKLKYCNDADLLVCEQGWIWILYYSCFPNQKKTHFAFVHADGNQLLDDIAYEIIKKGNFAGLTYIKGSSNIVLDKEKAQKAYFKYLETELGEIQFEGMPIDQETGVVKVTLENIFIPLRYNYRNKIKDDLREQTTIKGVLERTSKAAILAKPGGGKSTLIRRIALAYAYPERRAKIDDQLPDENWFPIYIRCRDLGENAKKNILEIISTIVYRAEITEYKEAFKALVRERLQEGKVLLLVDGLDEISNERYRISFVEQLRTFVGIYPNVRLLVTSRETGYRAVAGTISSYCEKYTIASLSENEIRDLSLRWHKAILGESLNAREESDKVCNIIMEDKRIIALAENPLLLTTLLFVKRWIGYLPTKKCQLYEEMIKLLLVTWNAVAHDKLDLDETEPQLAFVAYYMSKKGEQKITRDELEECIKNARQELPEILGYTQISPSKFIDQVEERSSLLIQLGMEENSRGKLVPSYEFSHLSFQEYLSAKAIVESWIPETSGHSIIGVLKPYINKGHWGEIIPLVAVLAGRREAKKIIEYLIELCEKEKKIDKDKLERPKQLAAAHLGNCIASEVPMNQELLEKAIELSIERSEIVRNSRRSNVFETILKSKYGGIYREIVKRNLFNDIEDINVYVYSEAWLRIVSSDFGKDYEIQDVLSLLQKESYEEKITGTLLIMQYAFKRSKQGNVSKKSESVRREIFQIIYGLLCENEYLSIYSAAWCIAWSGYGEADIIPHDLYNDIVNKLVELWIDIDCGEKLMRIISWAVSSICIQGVKIEEKRNLKGCIDDRIKEPRNEFDETSGASLAVLTNYWSKNKAKSEMSKGIIKSRFLSEIV